MNLYRYVKGIGLNPLVCGNIKGMYDPYRTPATQKSFAEKWGQQDPAMVTSFADGTKVSIEQTLVANATGMKVTKRGMNGFRFDGHVDQATELYDVDELQRTGGIVDYIVGAKPSPGVFVFATMDNPRQRRYLNLYKLGEGPLYSFYQPYHLCHFDAPSAAARVVLFKDAVIQPIAGPVADVVATAKTDLKAGDTIDGLGGYLTYGVAEDAGIVQAQRLLPIGIAEGSRLKRNVPKDRALTYDDVDLPAGRLSVALRVEQDARFAPR